jgi:phosphate transport system protein
MASRDVSGARAVRNADLRIDDLNNALFYETLVDMSADPHNIAVDAHILFCVKNLERIGDHATNIAEAVDYIVSGQVPASDRPKGNTARFAAVRAAS